MEYAIMKLKQDEVVLMKRIKAMKDGKPKWSASEQLQQIRTAIKLLERYDVMTAADAEDEEEYLKEAFTQNPPRAQA